MVIKSAKLKKIKEKSENTLDNNFEKIYIATCLKQRKWAIPVNKLDRKVSPDVHELEERSVEINYYITLQSDLYDEYLLELLPKFMETTPKKY